MRYPKTRRKEKIYQNEILIYLCRPFPDLSKMLRVFFMGLTVAKIWGLETKPFIRNYLEKNAKEDKQMKSIIKPCE